MVDNWFIQVGDIIACHPEGSSVIKGRPGDNATEGFKERVEGVKVVFTAHTHNQAKLFHNDILSIEIGCMCVTQDYAINGKIGSMWKRPQQLGYGVAELVKGKAIFNRCDFKHIKTESKIL